MCKPTGPSSASKGCYLTHGSNGNKQPTGAASFWKSRPILIDRKSQQTVHVAGSFGEMETSPVQRERTKSWP